MSENVFLNTTYAEGCIRSLSCPCKKNLFLLYLLQARCWKTYTVFSDDTDREGWGGVHQGKVILRNSTFYNIRDQFSTSHGFGMRWH